jgi:hypothetical protein
MSENFNYIAFGNREYVEGAVDIIEMNRGRMFEYTPTDIEKRLEDLDPTSITFLEKLPTFLCSEISREGRAASMAVKYGRIANTTPGRKEVSTRFKTLIDFGDIEFADVYGAQDLFGADGFQLYRTHWAVMDGDVQEILTKLVRLKPELADAVAGQLKPDLAAAAAEPPPRTKNTIGIANAWKRFFNCCTACRRRDRPRPFFADTRTRSLS